MFTFQFTPKKNKNVISSFLKRGMFLFVGLFLILASISWSAQASVRERISLNADWRFQKGDPNGDSAGLIYDVRPDVGNRNDVVPADAMPTEAVKVEATQAVLKPWIQIGRAHV